MPVARLSFGPEGRRRESTYPSTFRHPVGPDRVLENRPVEGFRKLPDTRSKGRIPVTDLLENGGDRCVGSSAEARFTEDIRMGECLSASSVSSRTFNRRERMLDSVRRRALFRRSSARFRRDYPVPTRNVCCCRTSLESRRVAVSVRFLRIDCGNN